MKPEISFYLYIISTLIFTDSMVVQCIENGERKMLSELKSSQCFCNVDAVYVMQYYFSNKNENIELSQQDCTD